MGEFLFFFLLAGLRRALFRLIGRACKMIWRALGNTRQKWHRQVQIKQSPNVVPFRRPYRTR